MAVTEITKILFRRGKSKDRVDLQQYGGLANGEPGWTSSEGYWEGTAPDRYDRRSTILQNRDVIRYDTTFGGGDLFMGSTEGADIYIGGSSAEKHWQNYFISLRGTGNNTTYERDDSTEIARNDATDRTGFIDGRFEVGRNGGTTGRDTPTTAGSDLWYVKFYGNRVASQASLAIESANNNDRNVSSGSTTQPSRMMLWDPNYDALELWSNTALKIPAGSTALRPGGTGENSAYGQLQGQIRYNTDANEGFEGYDGAQWVSLQGSMDRLNHTYVTVFQGKPTWGSNNDVKGVTGMIKFVVGRGSPRAGELAGWFANSKEFHCTNDIVAFSSSDSRQKDNIQPISEPVKKLNNLEGVTFEWNEQGPAWVDDRQTRDDVGLIAQQVEQVIPEAVVTRDDGFKAVDYKRIIPLLVQSVKELSARVEQLEQQQ